MNNSIISSRHTVVAFAVIAVLIVLATFRTAHACGKEEVKSSATSDLDRKIELLIRTIDDDPDPLHLNFTPAMYRLADIGQPAISPLLDLALSSNESTRRHAIGALYIIVREQFGLMRGREYNQDLQVKCDKFWDSLGDLNFEQSYEDRLKSVRKWRNWLAQQPTKKDSK